MDNVYLKKKIVKNNFYELFFFFLYRKDESSGNDSPSLTPSHSPSTFSFATKVREFKGRLANPHTCNCNVPSCTNKRRVIRFGFASRFLPSLSTLRSDIFRWPVWKIYSTRHVYCIFFVTGGSSGARIGTRRRRRSPKMYARSADFRCSAMRLEDLLGINEMLGDARWFA